jgi:hypothetical protein
LECAVQYGCTGYVCTCTYIQYHCICCMYARRRMGLEM